MVKKVQPTIFQRFFRSETADGDFLVLTSKGQQEALFALEHLSEGVTAPILRLEHALHKFSAFVVMPLFAFAKAVLGSVARSSMPKSLPEYCSGLSLANRLGITAAAFGTVKSGITQLPAVLGGISARLCLPGRDRFYHVAVYRYACVR